MKRTALLLLLPLALFAACTDDSLPEIPKPIHYNKNPEPEPEKPANEPEPPEWD